MCGRATLTVDVEELAEVFALKDAPAIVPRFNIAPTQPLPIIKRLGHLEFAPWGTKERRVINVRLERATSKPEARCLVVVDGFYEWAGRDAGDDKQPFYFHRADAKPFALGGVLLGEGAAIVTTAPLEGIADIHDRMPLILAENDWEHWLAGAKPAPTFDGFERYPVSTFVGSPKNDSPKCIEATGPARAL
jgi:putative SOS response-associated peptidase YedK